MSSDNDSLRQQAINDIDDLNQSIAELEARREERRVFLRVLTEIEKSNDLVGNGEHSSADEIASCVRGILTAAGEPLDISQLYDEVLKAGLTIGGRNPKGNLSAKLAPYDDIMFIKGKGWKLSTFNSAPSNFVVRRRPRRSLAE